MTNDLKDLEVRASALLDEERWRAAIDLLMANVRKIRKVASLQWTLGWAQYKAGELRAAESSLRRAHELQPENPVFLWGLAVVQDEREEYESAEQNLLSALRLKDSNLARITLGALYLRQGRTAEAEAVYRDGVQLQPDHRERWDALADFLEDVGRRREADVLRTKSSLLPTRKERRRSLRSSAGDLPDD
ncbi:MAG TPA: tetratricopeptide repeat protein [Polyangiaceae bacterium]|mgnify:CR=1 FL=1|nr:tetratricopeptide repeat protein [Polyangiaceae bacterium]HMR77763.1 tetratricopeptide repeat protein [Polyangiaceae bacterium]